MLGKGEKESTLLWCGFPILFICLSSFERERRSNENYCVRLHLNVISQSLKLQNIMPIISICR